MLKLKRKNLDIVMGWIQSLDPPEKIYVYMLESWFPLPPSVSLVEDKGFYRSDQVKGRSFGGSLIQCVRCPYKREFWTQRQTHREGRKYGGTQGEDGHLQAGERLEHILPRSLRGNQPDDPSISDSRPPGLWENKFWLFRSHNLLYLALEN